MSKRERTVSFGFHVSVRYCPRATILTFRDGASEVWQARSSVTVTWHVFGWSGRWYRRWLVGETRTYRLTPRARQIGGRR